MRSTAEIVRTASLALTQNLELSGVLEAFLDCLAPLVPYDSGSILLAEGESRLCVRAVRGYADPEAIRDISFEAAGHPVLAEVLSSQRGLLIPDTTVHPGWERRAGAEHVGSWIGVPLLAGRQLVGLFSLDRAAPECFTEEHLELAENLAPYAGVAIHNAQLYARERSAREEAERLGAATRALSSTLDLREVFGLILSELRPLVPYDTAVVLELKGQHLELIGGHGFVNQPELLGLTFDIAGDNPNREVVRTRRPVILDDAPEHYPAFKTGPHAKNPVRSWLGVPLLFGDRLIGMLALDKWQPGFFGAEHARLASTFAAQAAIALENARLYAAAQRELGERTRAQAQAIAFVEHAPYGVVVLDRGERIRLANAEAERLFGYAREELLGQPLDLLVPERFREGRVGGEGARPSGSGLLAPGGTQLCGRRKDGSEFLADVSLAPLETEEGPLVLVAVQDVTERTRAEQALRRSEERFEKAFRASPAAMSLSSLREGRVLDVNERFLAMTGYGRDEVIGRTLGELRFWESPAEAKGVARELEERRTVSQRAFRYRTKSGELRDASGAFERVEVPEGPCVLALAEDVSERLKLEAQLREAQKMEAVGKLAGGIAHDFNNLLTAILGYSDLLLRRVGHEPGVRREVEEIKQAGERAASLTRQLLAFSRRQVLQPRVLDLGTVVENVKGLLRGVIGESVVLITRTQPGLGRVKADPAQLEQVLVNLAVNARDAMPQGGTLTIETSDARLDEPEAGEHPDVRPGAYVLLSVADTGCGMDAATQARVFEPFFTTKPEGQGTGLGLSTVYGIVKQSGGYLSVSSEPGRGSTFRTYLPQAQEQAVPEGARRDPAEIPRGQETVLVVEDQDMVRELVQEALELSGYQVLSAASGGEALELAARQKGPIHLLVTDVVMPGLSGRETADRLLGLRPGLRVLFMSGYTDDAVTRHGVQERGSAFLHKPFSSDALARKAREVLDQT